MRGGRAREAILKRCRLRLEATREFTVRDHSVVPFFKAEWFYATRYDGWARDLYQIGSEFTLSKRFRIEPHLARQADRLPAEEALNTVGITAKRHF